MVLVLILLGIFIILLSLFLLVIFSKLQISVNHFTLSNNAIGEEKLQIKVKFYLLKKIKIFTLNLSHERLNRIYEKEKDNIDQSKLIKKIHFNKETLRAIRKSEIELLEFDLNASIGFEDITITTGVVTLISILFPNVLSIFVDKYSSEKFKYTIHPIYNNQFQYDVHLNCIIEISIKEIYHILLFMQKNKITKEKRKDKKVFKRMEYNY